MVASEKRDWPRNRPSPASAHTIFLQRLAGRKPWKVPPSGNHRRGSTNCKNGGDDVKRLSSSYCFEQRLTRLLGDLSVYETGAAFGLSQVLLRFTLRKLKADISASADSEQTKQRRAERRHRQFIVNICDKHYSQDKCPDKNLEAVKTDKVVLREQIIHHPLPGRPCEVGTLPAIIRQPFPHFILLPLIFVQRVFIRGG